MDTWARGLLAEHLSHPSLEKGKTKATAHCHGTCLPRKPALTEPEEQQRCPWAIFTEDSSTAGETCEALLTNDVFKSSQNDTSRQELIFPFSLEEEATGQRFPRALSGNNHCSVPISLPMRQANLPYSVSRETEAQLLS